MTAETLTLVISFSALAFACLFVGRILKTLLKMAVLGAVVYVVLTQGPALKKIGCEVSAKFAGPVSLCFD